MHRTTSHRIPIVLVVVALVLAACGGTQSTATDQPASPSASPVTTATATAEPTESPGATESAEPTTAASDLEVIVGMSSFSPVELTIDAGNAVTFSNTSPLAHTVTHGSGGRAAEDAAFDKNVSEGGTVSITFDEPGTYEITCKFHPTMQMSVTVEG